MIFKKEFRQFVWALVWQDEAFGLTLRSHEEMQKILCSVNQVTHQFIESNLRNRAVVSPSGGMTKRFKLKSLIMAQIERWRQA